jgi:hypothetical protein
MPKLTGATNTILKTRTKEVQRENPKTKHATNTLPHTNTVVKKISPHKEQAGRPA